MVATGKARISEAPLSELFSHPVTECLFCLLLTLGGGSRTGTKQLSTAKLNGWQALHPPKKTA